ncbi:MAG TPA: hypothetical protein VF719_03980 [Abditibacteriaceae bacterium]|jgi:hypothetical protein
MKTEGPQLESLLRRLAECPADFLMPPFSGTAKDAARGIPRGEIYVAAVVSDLLRDLGETTPQSTTEFELSSRNRPEAINRLHCILIGCWLLHDEWFMTQNFAPAARAFLAHGLDELALLVDAPLLVSDADRREELTRLGLRGLGLRPRGESEAQAQDRLTTLNSAERHRVVLETRAAQERSREIREAMQRKAAEEAAAKYSRE